MPLAGSGAAGAPSTHPQPRWYGGALALLLLATLAGRLAVATAHHTSLIEKEIYKDDAFYYFSIAQHVVAGRGFSVDGVAATAGFQPLFQLLLLPLVRLTPGNLIAPLHAAGILSALVSVGTAIALFFLARRLGGGRSALLTLALWALSPYFIVHDINGQETALAVFGAVLTVLLYVAWMRGDGAPSPARAVALGVVVGLGVLARIDTLLLLAALLVDGAWRAWHLRRMRRDLRAGSLVLLAAFLTWLPWGAYSTLRLGQPLPSSGEASLLIALDLGWSNLQRIWTTASANVPRTAADVFFDADHPPPDYRADVATKLAFVAALEFPPLAPLRLDSIFDTHPKLHRYRPYGAFARRPWAGTVLALTLVAGVVWLVQKRRRPGVGPRSPGGGIGLILGVYAFLLAVGYTFYSPAHWNFNRYVIVLLLLGTAQLVARVHTAMVGNGTTSSWRRVAAVALGLLLIACQLNNLRFFRDLSWREVPPRGFLKAWAELEPYVRSARVLGAFQCGVIGYFSGRDVVNLDGKVNRDAFAALSSRRIDDYIRKRGIEFVMDTEPILYALYLRQLPAADAAGLEFVPVPAPVSLLRVVPRPGGEPTR